MKYALLLVIVLTQVYSFAQMGPCSLVGDVDANEAYYRVDEIPDQLDLGQAGDNNLWVFTNLQSPRTFTYHYGPAAGARYQNFFEEARTVLREPLGKEVFFMKRGNRWYEMGYVSVQKQSIEPEVVRYSIPINKCPSGLSNTPYAYQTSFARNGAELTQSYSDIQDASGILYLPDGYYDAHRVKRIITTNENSVSKVRTSFLFIDQITGELLVEVQMSTDALSPERVIYKSQAASVPKPVLSQNNGFLLYPNIGYGEVRMAFENFTSDHYEFVLFDLIGKKIWSTKYFIDGNVTIKEDLSFLPKGTYTYTIVDSKQNNIITRRLAIIKS